MSITVEQLIANAVALSGRAQQDIIANQPEEVLDQTNVLLKKWFAYSARVNRLYFGDTATIDFLNGRWARPTNAESVWLIAGRADTVPSTLAGEEIDPVPWDEQDAAPVAVAVLGRAFFPIAASDGPQGGKLDVTYSRVPQLLDIGGALGQTIDADWPEQMRGLLEVDLAIWVAGRDGRDDDVERLTAKLQTWQNVFQAHLEHAEANLVSRRSTPRPITPVGQASAG